MTPAPGLPTTGSQSNTPIDVDADAWIQFKITLVRDANPSWVDSISLSIGYDTEVDAYWLTTSLLLLKPSTAMPGITRTRRPSRRALHQWPGQRPHGR